MFEPVRGGTRGGQAEFKWSDVSADKDREVCIPHSMSPKRVSYHRRTISDTVSMPPRAGGRRTRTFTGTSETKIKLRRSDLRKFGRSRNRKLRPWPLHCMYCMLCFFDQSHDNSRGFAAGAKPGGPSAAAGPASGANAVAVPPRVKTEEDAEPDKEEKRRKKAERKEEKRLKREAKEKRKAERETEGSGRRHHRRSRSRSPRRGSHDPARSRSRHRSRTPPRHERDARPYDDVSRERARDRRRRDDGARHEQAASRWGRG